MKIIFEHFSSVTYKTEKFILNNVISVSSDVCEKDMVINVIVSEYPDIDKMHNARKVGFDVDLLTCDCDKIVAIRNVIKDEVIFYF